MPTDDDSETEAKLATALAEVPRDAKLDGSQVIDPEIKPQVLEDQDLTPAERPWYIFEEASTGRIIWDFFIIFLALVNGFIIPWELAFIEQFQKYDEKGHLRAEANGTTYFSWNQSFILVNYVSMVFFLVDIGICFFTSYLDISSGDVIFSLNKIASNYIFNGSFIVDILSTFPLKSWGASAGASEGLDFFLTILGILKVQRFLRTRSIISKLDLTVEWKATLSLLYMIILLLVYIHL